MFQEALENKYKIINDELINKIRGGVILDSRQEILDAIEIIVNKATENMTQIQNGTVVDIGENNTCSLLINGAKLEGIQYFGATPQLNKQYRAFIPNGNYSRAFIVSIELGNGVDYLPITEDMVTVVQEKTKGVSPYNTSYYYTNITVNGYQESDIHVGTIIVPIVVSKMIVASAYRNIRIRFGENGTWHPMCDNTATILAGSSYFVANQHRLYVYRKNFHSIGAFHRLNDSNTTYSPMSLGFGYGTCTTAADTVAKVVTLASYGLIKNGMVAVNFTNAVPAGATMNINSKGAKPIYRRGAAITSGIINAGETATFVYDGTNYIYLGKDT